MALLDLRRIYEYRFDGIDQAKREQVWAVISSYISEILGKPRRVLDPAGGRGEFIRSCGAPERWFIDVVEPESGTIASDVIVRTGDALEVDLPADYFDGIFVSNFLEHLATPNEIARFLQRMYECQAPGGRIAIIGPNFAYCSKTYFDCADHHVALTHVAAAEHLYGAGFRIERIVPRFLPYSFRGLLPPHEGLTSAYLQFPILWRFLGKQFLVIGRKVD